MKVHYTIWPLELSSFMSKKHSVGNATLLRIVSSDTELSLCTLGVEFHKLTPALSTATVTTKFELRVSSLQSAENQKVHSTLHTFFVSQPLSQFCLLFFLDRARNTFLFV